MDGIHAGILSEEEVLEMIASRKYWILVTDHPSWDDLEYTYNDGKLAEKVISVFGPPVGMFKNAFPDVHLLVVHFVKKTDLSADELNEFLISKGGVPGATDEMDIIIPIDVM